MTAPDNLGSAQWLFDRHRHAQAAAALADQLSRDPQCAPAHALLALCQCALKQNLLAKHHAEKAVELEPANPDYHFILAQVLIRLFDWEAVAIYARDGHRWIAKAAASPASMRAFQAIQEALRLCPDHPDYHAHLASLKLMFGRWGEALDAANTGLAKDPQSIACLHYRAITWLEMEETAKSEEATKALLALEPNSPHGHAGLGDLCLYRRQAKEAKEHYLEALRLNPLLVWAEQGLEAARRMEMGRAMVREYVTTDDPMFRDPYRALRWLHAGTKIIAGTFIALLVGQLLTAMIWPGHSLLDLVIKFLARL